MGAPPAPVVVRAALEQVAQYGVLGHTAAELLDVGTGPFLAYIEREVFGDLVAQGGATCRFFEGSYGSGKTHLLRLLGDRAAARGLAVVQTELSRDLGLEDWSLITRHILERVEVTRSAATPASARRCSGRSASRNWPLRCGPTCGASASARRNSSVSGSTG
jgi:hypothetical protein